MADQVLNVLFVGDEDCSRAVLAESLLNVLGQGRFLAFSASIRPTGTLRAEVLETLRQTGYATSELRFKSWKIFETFESPRLDVVITLNQAAANEREPAWYSDPVMVHWPFPETTLNQTDEDDRRSAVRHLYGDMEQQMLKLSGLKVAGLEGRDLQKMLETIAP